MGKRMNPLALKGIKQGKKASITSAAQNTMRIGYGSHLPGDYRCQYCYICLQIFYGCHLQECMALPSETSSFTGKTAQSTCPVTWDSHKACFLVNDMVWMSPSKLMLKFNCYCDSIKRQGLCEVLGSLMKGLMLLSQEWVLDNIGWIWLLFSLCIHMLSHHMIFCAML